MTGPERAGVLLTLWKSREDGSLASDRTREAAVPRPVILTSGTVYEIEDDLPGKAPPC